MLPFYLFAAREILLSLSLFCTLDLIGLELCPDELVCTNSILQGSSLCHKDDGSPLLTLQCENSRALCLMGIAVEKVQKENPIVNCKGESDFQVFLIFTIGYLLKLLWIWKYHPILYRFIFLKIIDSMQIYVIC